MHYLADNPWPLILLLTAVAVVAFLGGASRGKVVAMVSLILAVAVYLIEQQLISPGEEIEMEVGVMLDHFKSREIDSIVSQIDPAKESLAEMAQRGLDLVDVQPDFHIRNVEVTLESETRATALVRANGNVTLRKGSGGGRLPNYWRTVWIRQNGKWLLTEVVRLDPFKGTEIGVFSHGG